MTKEIIIPNILSTLTDKNKNTFEEIAKILTDNEGKLEVQINQEIFEMIMALPDVRSGVNTFFSKTIEGVSIPYEGWVEQTGIIDVIDGHFKKINWFFSVMMFQIPKKIYLSMDDKMRLKIAGEGKGKTLKKDVYFSYGDVRIYGDVNKVPPGGMVKGIYILGFKEAHKYG